MTYCKTRDLFNRGPLQGKCFGQYGMFFVLILKINGCLCVPLLWYYHCLFFLNKKLVMPYYEVIIQNTEFYFGYTSEVSG